MAFNFNWSPLTADADFYQRARHLLTKALNKPPKPPIIVDDIVVTEFNLGTLPPDLEILEIGDLAEDRFRGIFKMCYSGDAVFTLKTRVQANPLNTYLYSKPSFTSPQPLAAASGLTIPLSITLSEIKLSAFIILVFSKQKGLTLVFRNDQLDSLKVSSTFDSIQFVRDYLQRTIEQRLRDLMMDELPAIIHRLSLRLWCPDQANKGTGLPPQEQDDDVKGVNPFASPPLDPVDAHGNPLDPGAVSELTLNGGEMQLLFSQKNLLRLAALTDCHRTLSVFTPGIRDAVFRAWCGCADRSDLSTPALATPSPITSSSFPPDGSTTYTFSDSGSAVQGSFGPRSSIVSLNSMMTGAPSSHGTGLRSRPGRKKKVRVVNLRRAKSGDDLPDDGLSDKTDTSSLQAPSSDVDVSSVANDHGPIRELDNDDLASAKVHFGPALDTAAPAAPASRQIPASREPCSAADTKTPALRPSLSQTEADKTMAEKTGARFAADSASIRHGPPSRSFDASSAILEQASIMKMAGELARRIYEGKYQQSIWDEQDNPPPPAYEATSR